METIFSVIVDDFLADLNAISDLVAAVQSGGSSARSRLASVNSATLLLSATFEEFVREMGRQYAREVVRGLANVERLPRKLTATAWKRTLEDLARAKIDTGGTAQSLEGISRDARSKFDAVCGFLSGDMSQDVYGALVHNENNMRPRQLNEIFSICDLKNICEKFCEKTPIKDHFDEIDNGKVHGLFLVSLNDFMEKRNDIAHSLNPGSSSGPSQLLKEVDFFKATALSLAETLPEHLPISGLSEAGAQAAPT